MSHVDEGTLHAYLDALERGSGAGALDAAERTTVEAHLARCPACAAALAEARTLRGQADAVLSGAAPTIDVPPFETMSARRTSRRRQAGWVPLAWAASLVVAVGSGWVASELWRRGAGIGPGEMQPPATAAETVSVPGPGAQLTDVEVGEPQASPQGSAAPAGPAAAPEAERNGAEAATRQGNVAAGNSREAGDVPAVRDAQAKSTAVVPQTATEQLESRLPTPAAGEPRGLVRSAAPAAAAPPLARFREAAAPLLPQVAVSARDTLAYAGDAAVAWETIGLAVASQRLGAPLQLLSDATVISVGGAESGVVRVRQQLPSGAEAELVQWLPEPGSRLPDEAAAAANTEQDAVRVVREGIAADGRAWVLLAWPDRMLALKAPPGVLPLGLLPRLERER